MKEGDKRLLTFALFSASCPVLPQIFRLTASITSTMSTQPPGPGQVDLSAYRVPATQEQLILFIATYDQMRVQRDRELLAQIHQLSTGSTNVANTEVHPAQVVSTASLQISEEPYSITEAQHRPALASLPSYQQSVSVTNSLPINFRPSTPMTPQTPDQLSSQMEELYLSLPDKVHHAHEEELDDYSPPIPPETKTPVEEYSELSQQILDFVKFIRSEAEEIMQQLEEASDEDMEEEEISSTNASISSEDWGHVAAVSNALWQIQTKQSFMRLQDMDKWLTQSRWKWEDQSSDTPRAKCSLCKAIGHPTNRCPERKKGHDVWLPRKRFNNRTDPTAQAHRDLVNYIGAMEKAFRGPAMIEGEEDQIEKWHYWCEMRDLLYHLHPARVLPTDPKWGNQWNPIDEWAPSEDCWGTWGKEWQEWENPPTAQELNEQWDLDSAEASRSVWN